MTDLYKPIEAPPGQLPPVVIRAVTRPRVEELADGVPASSVRKHLYVLLEILPEDLQRRIEFAVQAAVAGR